MLEILLIRFCCGNIGETLRAKGRSPTGYQVLFVLCWFFGEIGGFIAGLSLLDSPSDGGFPFPAYLFALCGAGFGAGIAFLIAKSISPLAPAQGFEVTPFQAGGYPPAAPTYPPPLPPRK